MDGRPRWNDPTPTHRTPGSSHRRGAGGGRSLRVVLFALRNVERKDVKITQTRKAGLPLSKPQLLHVGAEARSVIRAWAEEEGVSVNAIMVSVLEEFFKRLRKSKALREELRLELRARRGFLPA